MVLFFLVALLLVPVAILISPRNALIPVLAWSLLPIGIFLLDERVHRIDSNGLGLPILGAWLLLIGLVLLLRALVETVRASRLGPPQFGPVQKLWSVPPIAMVAVILGLHWMATNWFAGFQPAWLAHLLLAAIASAGIWLARGRREHLLVALQPLKLGACVIALTLLVFTLSFVVQAASLASAAKRKAKGAPYCLLTTDGTRWRPAASWLELSPLVMRDRGRHAIDTHPWLVVRRVHGLKRYSWRPLHDRFSSAAPVEPAERECDPSL